MPKKSNIQKTILKILAEKPAISMQSIREKSPIDETGCDPKKGYALVRSMKNLIESGYAEIHKSDNQDYLKITPKGKNKLNTTLLEGAEALIPHTWDGFWRIIILDLPEERKSEREALRYLLKKANFICIKNTVWISPFPYENLFTNIKKDLNLTTELMILITNKLDAETNLAFINAVKGK